MADPLPFDADEPVVLTGERTAPGIPEENYWFQRHVAAYRYASELVAGRKVLDAGCGEGYGCDILAGRATAVVGIDLSDAVVRRAAARYPRVRFERAHLASLPYPDSSFGAVVSLQVIEHLHAPHELLAEAARVLAADGVLILSTPNRLTFSPDGLRNPFHTFEFSPAELRAALARHFGRVEMWGTFHGPRIRLVDALLRQPLPERLLAQPAPEWPRRLRRLVSSVRAEDFRIVAQHAERALDLIAVARR